MKITKLKNYRDFHKPEKEFEYLDGVIYGVDYAENPQIQAAIQQFKYRFTQELAEYFGDLLSDKLKQLCMAKGRRIILIPVPLHRKRMWERGFNQAELIAGAVKKRIGDQITVLNGLQRLKYTKQQAKLNKKDRHKNLKDAFSYCGAAPASRRANCGANGGPQLAPLQLHNSATTAPQSVYFIVDDVCTTGSTLESCAKVLKEAGIKKVYGLTVARAFKCLNR